MIERGDWQVSEIARNAFDLENKVVGTIGAGRIGYRILQRLVPFNCKELLYYDYTPLPAGECPPPNPPGLLNRNRNRNRTRNHRGAESHRSAQGRRPPRLRLTMRRDHRELPLARGHAEPRERGPPRALQAGRLAREHRARRDLRRGRGRRGARQRAAVRLRGRRVERAARAAGPRLARGEEPAWRRKRHGAALLGHDPRCAGAVCGGHQEHPC